MCKIWSTNSIPFGEMSENLRGGFFGLTLYIGGPHIQFCIAGLKDSSAEEPKIHKNSWRPRPHCGSSQRSRKPPSWWGGVVSPLSKNPGALAQPFGIRVSALVSPRNVDFVSTPLPQYGVWGLCPRKIFQKINVQIAYFRQFFAR